MGHVLIPVLAPALIAMLVIGSVTTAAAGDIEDCQGTTSATACRRLAEQGEAWAQRHLGWMYENGHGVMQDYTEAVKWYCKAAEQEDAEAQYDLGQLYRLGYGIQRNNAEAMRWFRRAADQGDGGAQYNLGFMYEAGRGVTRDLVRAYMWFDLAARSAEPHAHQGYAIQYRDSVASKMTPEQIAKAQQLVAEWKPKPSQ